jgi:hypothetical protein
MPRSMGVWVYRSTFSWPQHSLEVSGQLHAPAALPPGNETHSIGGWVGPTVSLANMKMRKFLTLLGLGRVAVNILNKQRQTADKGWSYSLGVRHGTKNSSPLKNNLVTKCYTGPGTWTDSLNR